MSEPFVGEIRMFAGNFAPRGWAFCDGQLLATSQNDALFSLLGTIYGGDGNTTFGLPDMRGRVPVHAGTGPGLSSRRLGQKLGTENETLSVQQIPGHSHQLRASGNIASRTSPQNNLLGKSTNADLYTGDTPDGMMAGTAVNNTGGSQSHSNMQPYLCLNFIISLIGIYPSRS